MRRVSYPVNSGVSGKRGHEKVLCPSCHEEMVADLHGPIEKWGSIKPVETNFMKRLKLDNWWCNECEILVDRISFVRNCYWVGKKDEYD